VIIFLLKRNNNIVILDVIIYCTLYDNIIDPIVKEGRDEYLEKNILAESNKLDQNKEETKENIKEIKTNNNKIRYIIKNTIIIKNP